MERKTGVVVVERKTRMVVEERLSGYCEDVWCFLNGWTGVVVVESDSSGFVKVGAVD